MGLLHRIQARILLNARMMRLSYMRTPQQIAAFCGSLGPAERAELLAGIEQQFRWNAGLSAMQAMMPRGSGSGISAEAADMAIHGQLPGGLELMRQEREQQPTMGLTPGVEAALVCAWKTLKAMGS
jgi:hypothetical protein